MAEEDRVRDLLARAAAGMPGGPVVPPPDLLANRPRRYGRAPLLAGAFVLVLLAALPAWLLTTHRTATQRPGPTVPTFSYPTAPATLPTYPATGPGTVERLAAGHWDRLPAAPIEPTSGAATVWTGAQFIVWGGSNGSTDGAAYDPADRTWQKLPPAPLSARADATALWTGTEVLIFGGSTMDGGALADGAGYNPATRTWRPIAAAPIPVHSDSYALWDGAELVVLGAITQDSSGAREVATDVAAYDPVSDSWRLLPPLPTLDQTVFATAATTPAGVVVWAYSFSQGQISPNEFEGTDRVTRFRYDPGAGTWSVVFDEPDTMYQASPLWTGQELIRPAGQVMRAHSGPMGFHLSGARIDPDTLAETAIAHGPLDDFQPSSVWTGAALLSFDIGNDSSIADETVHRGQTAAWDPATDTWTDLPDAPYYGQSTDMSYAWTGTQLLLWGPLSPGDGTSGLSFTP